MEKPGVATRTTSNDKTSAVLRLVCKQDSLENCIAKDVRCLQWLYWPEGREVAEDTYRVTINYCSEIRNLTPPRELVVQCSVLGITHLSPGHCADDGYLEPSRVLPAEVTRLTRRL